MVEKSKAKYIQSLSQKKLRDEEGVFVAEGPKIINELLAEPTTRLRELFATKEWLNTNDHSTAGAVTEVNKVMLGRLSFLTTPNQVLGIFSKPVPGRFAPQGQVSLLLQTIQDPGNMGSIIRCADWFGVTQIVCSRDCVDAFSPKTVQSTMGSIARVKVFYDDLAAVINAHRNVNVYAAALDGQSIREMSAPEEAMILIGNESKGISRELLDLCSGRITIPGKGGAESLNAAVATGIILSHLVG
jgi:TrmH family RNA methyltransferase